MLYLRIYDTDNYATKRLIGMLFLDKEGVTLQTEKSTPLGERLEQAVADIQGRERLPLSWEEERGAELVYMQTMLGPADPLYLHALGERLQEEWGFFPSLCEGARE